MRNRIRFAAFMTATAVAAGILAFGTARLHAKSFPTLASHISEADALARVRPIVANIWPACQDAQLMPELTVARQGGMLSHEQQDVITVAWQVVCEDAHGRSLGTITVNANTGDLLSVSAGSESAVSDHSQFARMKRIEARSIMRQWVISLATGNSKIPGDWQEVREQAQDNAFISDWRIAGQSCHVTVNARTGELLTLRVIHLVIPIRRGQAGLLPATRPISNNSR